MYINRTKELCRIVDPKKMSLLDFNTFKSKLEEG